MRVVGIIRVSNESQEDGYSLEAQERAIRAYADERGWELVKLYSDVASGRTDQRAGLQLLLAELGSLRPGAVIVHNIDRSMRDLRALLNFKHELDTRRIRLIGILDNIDTGNLTPEGAMFFHLKGALAQWYSDNLGREVRKGLREKAAQGLWVGPVPFGYQMGTTIAADGASTSSGVLIPHPEEAPQLVQAFIWRSFELSFAEIAGRFRERGWTVSDWRRKGRHLPSAASFRTMLSNRVYIGYTSFKDAEFQGKHAALVTQKLWDQVQLVNEQRHRRGRVAGAQTATHAVAILGSLGRCAVCDGPIWRHSATHYRCSRRSGGGCTASMINIAAVEQHLTAYIACLSVPPEREARVLALAQRIAADQRQQPRVIDTSKLRARLERLRELFLDGEMSKGEYAVERDAIKSQLAVADAMEQPSVGRDPFDLDLASALLADMRRLFSVATAEERRGIVAQLFSAVWVRAHHIEAVRPTKLFWSLMGLGLGAVGEANSASDEKSDSGEGPSRISPHTTPAADSSADAILILNLPRPAVWAAHQQPWVAGAPI